LSIKSYKPTLRRNLLHKLRFSIKAVSLDFYSIDDMKNKYPPTIGLYFPFLILGIFLTFAAVEGCTMLQLRRSNPTEIGAVAESSSYLSDVITSEVPQGGRKKRILEVGAGTGVFTEFLIKKLGPDDHLDVVELIPELCKILEDRFGSNQQVKIFCGDILAWKSLEPYDYIISGLPFNSFNATLIQNIVDKLLVLSHEGTKCAFFEYKWLPSIRPIGMNKKEAEEFNESRKVIERFIKKYETTSKSVYLNMPPAVVHFLNFGNS
jgi:phospholipid N-methyltransferase